MVLKLYNTAEQWNPQACQPQGVEERIVFCVRPALRRHAAAWDEQVVTSQQISLLHLNFMLMYTACARQRFHGLGFSTSDGSAYLVLLGLRDEMG